MKDDFSHVIIATERWFLLGCFPKRERSFVRRSIFQLRMVFLNFLSIAHFFSSTSATFYSSLTFFFTSISNFLFIAHKFFTSTQDFHCCQSQNNGFGSFVLPSDGFDHLRWIKIALVRRIRANGSKVNLRKIAVGGLSSSDPSALMPASWQNARGGHVFLYEGKCLGTVTPFPIALFMLKSAIKSS